MKSRINVDLELRDKSQKELEGDLTNAKHNLLEVRHQLNMAEKVRIFIMATYSDKSGAVIVQRVQGEQM